MKVTTNFMFLLGLCLLLCAACGRKQKNALSQSSKDEINTTTELSNNTKNTANLADNEGNQTAKTTFEQEVKTASATMDNAQKAVGETADKTDKKVKKKVDKMADKVAEGKQVGELKPKSEQAANVITKEKPDPMLEPISKNPMLFPSMLTIGNGGGFTGEVTAYHILGNGDVLKTSTLGGRDTTFLKTLSPEELRQIHNQSENLKLKSTKFNHPGNMYYFVNLTDPQHTHRITWGHHTHKIPEPIRNFYKKTLDLVSEAASQ